MVTTVTLNPSLDEWVHLPRLRLGALHRTARFLRYPGGKGVNVSRVLHELGQRTLAVALAGGDDGKILRELLHQRGIAHRFVVVGGSTRNNYQIQTDQPRAVTQINCAGPRVASAALPRLERLLAQSCHRNACVVLSGSLPPGLPATTYQRLITRLMRCGVRAVLDASGAALRFGVAAKPWLIKPNRQEAEELLGRRPHRIPGDAASAATRLAASTSAVVIVSLGSDGAVLAAPSSAQVLWATSPAVPVRSTVGAGDSLVAGFLVGWDRTKSLREALRLGVACGAASVMTPGTELCHARDVQRLKPQITITVL